MMARYHDVPVSERGVQEYIQVLKTEKAALRARQAAEAEQPQELLGYLEALREAEKIEAGGISLWERQTKRQ